MSLDPAATCCTLGMMVTSAISPMRILSHSPTWEQEVKYIPWGLC